jgi:hypothetical protein
LETSWRPSWRRGPQPPWNFAAQSSQKREAEQSFFCFFFGNSQAVQKLKKISKNKEFFFKKKNQKTFAPLREVVARPLAKNDQSFFASFCSQKEVLPFFVAF